MLLRGNSDLFCIISSAWVTTRSVGTRDIFAPNGSYEYLPIYRDALNPAVHSEKIVAGKTLPGFVSKPFIQGFNHKYSMNKTAFGRFFIGMRGGLQTLPPRINIYPPHYRNNQNFVAPSLACVESIQTAQSSSQNPLFALMYNSGH